MAIAGLPSIVDFARMCAPDGSPALHIAQLLSQCNQIMKDLIYREGNLPLGNKITVGTGLPQGTWRGANAGVGFSKMLTAQLEDSIGELVGYSGVDRSIAEIGGDVAKFRYRQDMAHIEGLSQQISTALIYSNEAVNPGQITGFMPRYNTVNTATAMNAVNVIDAGGTASANASILLVSWGDNTTYAIHPKGTPAGITYEDKGDVRALYDASNNQFEGYTSYFRIKIGLSVEDWRYNVRIANIDTTAAGLKGTTPPDLNVLIAQAVGKLPSTNRRIFGAEETDDPSDPKPGTNPVLYCNRTVREWLDIQAIRDKNVLITPKEYAGETVLEWRGIPIRLVDSMLNTESRVV